MASSAKIHSRVTVADANGVEVMRDESDETIADVVGTNGDRTTVTLSAAFNALTVPSGAVFVRIVWVSGTGTLTLKGVTGDTGIAMGALSATSPAIMLPVSSPSIGILASGSGSVEVTWL